MVDLILENRYLFWDVVDLQIAGEGIYKLIALVDRI
jgi:hypothetical protein